MTREMSYNVPLWGDYSCFSFIFEHPGSLMSRCGFSTINPHSEVHDRLISRAQHHACVDILNGWCIIAPHGNTVRDSSAVQTDEQLPWVQGGKGARFKSCNPCPQESTLQLIKTSQIPLSKRQSLQGNYF